MYPNRFFGLFPPFPRENKVFVAMSFDARFDERWENVIKSAISRVVVGQARLEPHRVDTRRVSDSILTEILGGIANDRLILADITALDELNGRPMRNANVMYEVGLAQAMRVAEEVLIFRSDTYNPDFDVAHIRLRTYDPDDQPQAAQDQVAEALVGALREVELTRNVAVKTAARALDLPGWLVLTRVMQEGTLQHPSGQTMRQVLGNIDTVAAIGRLLELGAIETQ